MKDFEQEVNFNDIGQVRITIEQTKYEDFEVFELPKHCGCCPVGFSCSGNCGRNVPFQPDDYNRRPDTCKLKKVG